MTPPAASARDERGFALIIVLWSVVLLTLIVTGLSATGRTEVQLASNLRAAAVAEAAADGAVHEAIYRLLDPQSPWAADNAERVLQVPGATVIVRVEDNGGKLNPNRTPPELLAALMRRLDVNAGTATQVARAIVDWRDPGDPVRPREVIVAQYRTAGRSYGPPGAPFLSLDELGAVLGMTPELLDRLTPYLTVLTDTAADPALARPILQQAMADVSGPPLPVARRPPRSVTITAQANGAAGGQFTRRASVKLGNGPKEPLFLIQVWEAPGR